MFTRGYNPTATKNKLPEPAAATTVEVPHCRCDACAAPERASSCFQACQLRFSTLGVAKGGADGSSVKGRLRSLLS
jgi:hypothetical protein